MPDPGLRKLQVNLKRDEKDRYTPFTSAAGVDRDLGGIRMIERIKGTYLGFSKSAAYKDLVWTVAAASDESLDLAGQTAQTLNTIERNLLELGSDKTRIVSAQVYIADIADKPAMHEVWKDWIGGDPDNWPQRACLGVDLGGHWLIEVTVTAVRNT